MQHAVQIASNLPQIVAVRQLAKVERQIFSADVVPFPDARLRLPWSGIDDKSRQGWLLVVSFDL
jgi:hypothetical protein